MGGCTKLLLVWQDASGGQVRTGGEQNVGFRLSTYPPFFLLRVVFFASSEVDVGDDGLKHYDLS